MTIMSSWAEIACDESGFSGSNLLDPASPVITHASVDLSVPEATEVVAVLRSRLHHRHEFKSARLLRPGQRPALEWFLTRLRGRAHVHVIDKTGYVAARVVELFTEEPSYGAGTTLGRDHSGAVLALRRHTTFLAAFVDLTRTKRVRLIGPEAIDRFFAAMPAGVPGLREVTRARVGEVMARLLDEDRAFPPPLEPLVPALAETLLFWSAGVRSVAVVHDEQSALTRGRVARLGTFLAGAVFPAPPPLRSFLQVDSRDDPRVQVADLLAGIARRRPPGLDGMLAPYLRADHRRGIGDRYARHGGPDGSQPRTRDDFRGRRASYLPGTVWQDARWTMEGCPMEITNLGKADGLPPVDWPAVAEKLDARSAPAPDAPNSRTTWLSTVNQDGSPHVTAVGALWLDGTFWFQTGAGTRKGRNVARDPRCSIAVSVRDADVVLEGDAVRVTEPGALARAAQAWADNGWPAEPDDSGLGITAPFNAPSLGPPPWNVYRIQPRSAIVTLSTEPGGLTRFRF